MSLPKLNWARQNQISFDVGSMGNPAIVSGTDDSLYFAAFVKGSNAALTQPPPTTQYEYNQYASASSSYNLVIGKYYPNGPFTLSWYQYFYDIITPSDSSEISMTIGKDNELYVAFTTTGSTPLNLNMALVPPFGSCKCTDSFGYNDVVVARINTTGTPTVAWRVQNAYINSCNDESAPQIAVDTTNGLLYIAYQCNKNILCYTAFGKTNILVSCFNLNGQQLWIETGTNINSVGNTNNNPTETNAYNDNPTIAADLSGGVYIAYETTATVSGGAEVIGDPGAVRQIEMVKFQNNVVSYGVISGYSRSWVLSSITNIFSYITTVPLVQGYATTPSLTFKNNRLYLGFITTGTVAGGSSTTTNSMVIGSLTTNGVLIWLRQGPQFNQTAYTYTDCSTPYVITDNQGFVYISMLTVSPGTDVFGNPSNNENILLFKLDIATGTPTYNTIYKTETYNVYPLARQNAPAATFPVPAPIGSFSRLAFAFNGLDMYAVLTTTQVAPTQTKTSPSLSYDLCFLAYDSILLLPLTSPFLYMLNNKSICSCAGACGCKSGSIQVSIVYGVMIDALTSSSTTLSSTWSINEDSQTTVQYYATATPTPTGGTPVGTLQTVASGITTNTLFPAYLPDAATYYYCIVTPQFGIPVTSLNIVTPVPEPIAGSLSFNGTDQYLSFDSPSPGVTIGNGAFTVEGWFLSTGDFTPPRTILGVTQPPQPRNAAGLSIIVTSATTIILDSAGGLGSVSFTIATPLEIDTWYHIAISRNTIGKLNLFVGGIGSGVVDNFVNPPTDTNVVNYSGVSDWIGQHYNGYWQGYITNYRIVVGTAVYDPTATTITPPSGQLTAITDTQYLMLGVDVTTDTSGEQTVTNNGDVTITTPSIVAPTSKPF